MLDYNEMRREGKLDRRIDENVKSKEELLAEGYTITVYGIDGEVKSVAFGENSKQHVIRL
jgi:hypothetical protein